MPSARIRPTRQTPNYKRIAVTGAGGSAVTAMSDQSDATYVRRKANKAPMARFVLAAPSVPAGNDIATIVPGARLKQPTSRPPKLVTLAMSVPGSGKPQNKIAPTVTGPVVRAGSGTNAYNFATPAGAGKTAGPTGPWSGLLSVLAVRVNDGHDRGRRQPRHDLRPLGRRLLLRAADRGARGRADLARDHDLLPGDHGHALGPGRVLAGQQRRAGQERGRLGAQGLLERAVRRGGLRPGDLALRLELSGPHGAARLRRRVHDLFRGRHRDAAGRPAERHLQPPTPAAGAASTPPSGGAWATLTFAINVAPTPAPTLSAVLEDAAQRVALTVTAEHRRRRIRSAADHRAQRRRRGHLEAGPRRVPARLRPSAWPPRSTTTRPPAGRPSPTGRAARPRSPPAARERLRHRLAGRDALRRRLEPQGAARLRP